MAIAYKVLGQSTPSATTLTDLYTVPASTEAIVSTFTVANRAGSAATFRLAVAPAGASNSNEHYIYYDVAIPGNDTFAATIGISLEATDVVRVYASNTNLTFNIFGTEIT